MTVWSYDDAEQVAVRIGPHSLYGHCSIPTVTWLQLSTFPAGFLHVKTARTAFIPWCSQPWLFKLMITLLNGRFSQSQIAPLHRDYLYWVSAKRLILPEGVSKWFFFLNHWWIVLVRNILYSLAWIGLQVKCIYSFSTFRLRSSVKKDKLSAMASNIIPLDFPCCFLFLLLSSISLWLVWSGIFFQTWGWSEQNLLPPLSHFQSFSKMVVALLFTHRP